MSMKASELRRNQEKNWWYEVCATIDNHLEDRFNDGGELVILYFEHNYTRGLTWKVENRLFIHEALRKRVEERLERNGFVVMKIEHTALNGSIQNKTYISLF